MSRSPAAPRSGVLPDGAFIQPAPHVTFVHGEDGISWLKKRVEKLSKLPAFAAMECARLAESFFGQTERSQGQGTSIVAQSVPFHLVPSFSLGHLGKTTEVSTSHLRLG